MLSWKVFQQILMLTSEEESWQIAEDHTVLKGA